MNRIVKRVLTVGWSCFYLLIIFLLIGAESLSGPAMAQDVRALVEGAVNYLRGDTSESLVHMTIHRPDWERKIPLRHGQREIRKAFSGLHLRQRIKATVR